MKTLNGYKSYLGMIAFGVLGICVAQGWVEGKMAATIAAILGPILGVSIKHSWDKKSK